VIECNANSISSKFTEELPINIKNSLFEFIQTNGIQGLVIPDLKICDLFSSSAQTQKFYGSSIFKKLEKLSEKHQFSSKNLLMKSL
jgi:hypothetical protein